MNSEAYKYLVRPGTPEDKKRLENNNKIELAQRRVNTRKKYGLDPKEEDLAIINNGVIQTKKQFFESQPIDERPGYDPNKDNNLLRRLKYWGGLEGQNFGKEFDKAIAQEDLALKKLGEKQQNLLQRNKKQKRIISEDSKQSAERTANLIINEVQRIYRENSRTSNQTPAAENTVQAPIATPVRQVPLEELPEYRNTIFGSNAYYRRKRGL